MHLSRDTMLGLGAVIMDSSNSLVTRLMTGLLLFQLCILWMGGLFRAFTGAESMLEVRGIGLHRVAATLVHPLVTGSCLLLGSSVLLKEMLPQNYTSLDIREYAFVPFQRFTVFCFLFCEILF